MANIPDVLVAASKVYKLLLENDRVRVLEIRLQPGETAPMHDHPNDHVVIPKNDARLKLSTPEGKEQVLELRAGQVFWHGPGPHQGQNAGGTVLHNLVIEIKK